MPCKSSVSFDYNLENMKDTDWVILRILICQLSPQLSDFTLDYGRIVNNVLSDYTEELPYTEKVLSLQEENILLKQRIQNLEAIIDENHSNQSSVSTRIKQLEAIISDSKLQEAIH
eukprot:TRINITY_DN3242_c0_g1_i1.p1 TRINITY_DN3242_c0_g1~~TRINITY_DN3242_c0_g1_i1.p1  ORF type:complete len:125 (-),score=17.02 TRINITY_DN3242_c0_g1_i1:29-376(-)